MSNKISPEKFFERCNRVHNNKYDYSRSNFTRVCDKISINCSLHGEFEQVACDHACGHGCRKCYDKTNISWSTDDDIFMKQNYGVKSAQQCAEFLHKTLSAVYSRASFLKLAKRIPPQKYENLPNGILNQIRIHAKAKNREMTITEEDLIEIYNKQKGKCILSGWPIFFAKNNQKASASVDRKDCKKGYTKDNIQLTHVDVNLAKRVYSDEYFIKLCSAVAEHHKNKSCES